MASRRTVWDPTNPKPPVTSTFSAINPQIGIGPQQTDMTFSKSESIMLTITISDDLTASPWRAATPRRQSRAFGELHCAAGLSASDSLVGLMAEHALG
jgi:hypothetical protein